MFHVIPAYPPTGGARPPRTPSRQTGGLARRSGFAGAAWAATGRARTQIGLAAIQRRSGPFQLGLGSFEGGNLRPEIADPRQIGLARILREGGLSQSQLVMFFLPLAETHTNNMASGKTIAPASRDSRVMVARSPSAVPAQSEGARSGSLETFQSTTRRSPGPARPIREPLGRAPRWTREPRNPPGRTRRRETCIHLREELP